MLKSIVFASLLTVTPEVPVTATSSEAGALWNIAEMRQDAPPSSCVDALEALLPGTLQIEQPLPGGNRGEADLRVRRAPAVRDCALV